MACRWCDRGKGGWQWSRGCGLLSVFQDIGHATHDSILHRCPIFELGVCVDSVLGSIHMIDKVQFQGMCHILSRCNTPEDLPPQEYVLWPSIWLRTWFLCLSHQYIPFSHITSFTSGLFLVIHPLHLSEINSSHSLNPYFYWDWLSRYTSSVWVPLLMYKACPLCDPAT